MKCITSIVFLALYTCLCFGQQIDQFKIFKSAFPEDDKLILLKTENLAFELFDNKLQATSNTYEESFWLSEKSQYQRKDVVSYGLFNELVSISAKTLVPYKKKTREYVTNDFTVSDYRTSGVFYDDVKLVTFNYPNLSKGCRTIKEYSNKITDPHLLTSYYFGSVYPVATSIFKLTIPESVKFNYKLINCDSSHVVYSKTSKGHNIIHTWKVRRLPKIPKESNSPGIREISPHIVYYIEEYKSADGKTHKVFSGPTDLFNWYTSMLYDTAEIDKSLVKGMVDSLVKNHNSDIEKVKSIYYWVQDNIKYIAVEYGMGGYKPRRADVVLKRRYGDCKDMSNLINTMLKYANIESHLTWVGTRDIPYSFSDIPTPSVNNHMIVTCILNGQYYFLDAASGFLPLDIPSSFIQGKEAMVSLGRDKYEIIKIPVVTSNCNQLNDTINLTINNDDLTGTGRTYYKGYFSVDFFSMINFQDSTNTKNSLEKEFFKGSNKYHIHNYEIGNIYNREIPSQINYSFSIPDYAVIIDSNVFINLNLDKTILDSKIDENRLTDYIFEYKGIQSLTVKLKIPSGFSVDYIPKGGSRFEDGFGYSIDYKLEDGYIVYNRNIKIDLLRLSNGTVRIWNQTVSSFRNDLRNLVVLKKISN